MEEPVKDESLLEEESLVDRRPEVKPEITEKPQAPVVPKRETEIVKAESLPFFKSSPVTEKPSPVKERAVSQIEDKTITPDITKAEPERGAVTEEIPQENIYAPPAPDETLAPVQEKPGTTLPFKPSAELKSASALDMDQLDQAIEHVRDDTEKTRVTESGVKPVSDSGGDRAAGPSVAGTDIPSAETPLIEWDEEGRKRTLIDAGPKVKIPDWVKEEGLDLQIAVTFAVTPQGHTTSVAVGKSSGYPDVDSAVLEVVRKMKFNPAKVSENVTGTIKYIISTK